MKIINHDKLHEAIMNLDNGIAKNYNPVEDKDCGTSTVVYSDAIRQMKNNEEIAKKNMEEVNKTAEEFADSNQPDDNQIKTDALKKLTLDESLFTEASDEKYSALDEADPHDLLYTLLTEPGEQLSTRDPVTGKYSPRIVKGLYNVDNVVPAEDDNIKIIVDTREELDKARDLASKYEIDIVDEGKSSRLRHPYFMILDPYSMNLEKMLQDNKIPTLKEESLTEKLSDKLLKGRYTVGGEDVDGNEFIITSTDDLERAKVILSDTLYHFESGKGYIYDSKEQKEIKLDESLRCRVVECKSPFSVSKSLNEVLVIDSIDLNTYEGTEDGQVTLDRIKEAGKIDEFENLLDEMYPNGISATALDDLLRFESDWIFDMLGIKEEE